MADFNKAREGAQIWAQMLRRASDTQLADKLEEALLVLVDSDRQIEVKKQALSDLDAQIAQKTDDSESQRQRGENARKAADDIVAASQALADKSKADLANQMRKAQDAQGAKQAELDALEKLYAARNAQLIQAYADNETGLRQALVSVQQSLDAEVVAKKNRLDALQGEYDALKAKLAALLSA